MVGKSSCPVEQMYTEYLPKKCKINYLPSLMSSINASPAFFWIEFCHSWKEKQTKYEKEDRESEGNIKVKDHVDVVSIFHNV